MFTVNSNPFGKHLLPLFLMFSEEDEKINRSRTNQFIACFTHIIVFVFMINSFGVER